tara:strand:- start:1367 stop:1825 length:459 start_codon:yes stop_codon:yes gene_type:complete
MLEVTQKDFVSDLSDTPRFGSRERDLSYLGYRYVVVEVGQKEGRQAKWKPGFYLSSVTPEEAHRRLIQSALVRALGEENIVRVIDEATTDFGGDDALKITVVIKPGAAKLLSAGASLDALVRVREQLSRMQDERTPAIEYATEDELAEDGTS